MRKTCLEHTCCITQDAKQVCQQYLLEENIFPLIRSRRWWKPFQGQWVLARIKKRKASPLRLAYIGLCLCRYNLTKSASH